MITKVDLGSRSIDVDLRDDFYGAAFWSRISRREYEPDTLCFIQNNCDEMTDFLDLGTANGAMALISAVQGARVFAYEPNPLMYRVAKKNISLNGDVSANIQLVNKAVSSEAGILIYRAEANPSILSSIVFSGKEISDSEVISVLSLGEELDQIHRDSNRNVVLKMDIEGAEWRILNSASTLLSLKKHQSLLLLAIHPGFHRPFRKKLRGLDRLRVGLWHYKNFRESVKLFDLLSEHASIYRTNLNSVTSRKVFGGLILFGYHEFIVNFAQSKLAIADPAI
jgi:FkbM family methyltransferase